MNFLMIFTRRPAALSSCSNRGRYQSWSTVLQSNFKYSDLNASLAPVYSGHLLEVTGAQLPNRKERRSRRPKIDGHRAFVVYDEAGVVRLLRAAIEREGGQSAFARRYGLDRSHLNQVLLRNKPVSASIAKTIGLRRVYVAE
jgi:hypothetical protein